jgi:transcriptional regulator with XRE-family HTH domain
MNDDDQIPPWTLGWRLQRALSWADMNTEEMAYELGVARSTVSRWCNDKGHPTRGYLKLWAQRTRVPLNWLLQGDSGLPRRDSNPQSAGLDPVPRPFGAAEKLAMSKLIPISAAQLIQSARSR